MFHYHWKYQIIISDSFLQPFFTADLEWIHIFTAQYQLNAPDFFLADEKIILATVTTKTLVWDPTGMSVVQW